MHAAGTRAGRLAAGSAAVGLVTAGCTATPGRPASGRCAGRHAAHGCVATECACERHCGAGDGEGAFRPFFIPASFKILLAIPGNADGYGSVGHNLVAGFSLSGTQSKHVVNHVVKVAWQPKMPLLWAHAPGFSLFLHLHGKAGRWNSRVSASRCAKTPLSLSRQSFTSIKRAPSQAPRFCEPSCGTTGPTCRLDRYRLRGTHDIQRCGSTRRTAQPLMRISRSAPMPRHARQAASMPAPGGTPCCRSETLPMPGAPPADPRPRATTRRRASSASRRRRHSVRQASRRGGGPCCASISDAAAAAPQPARSQSPPTATAASSAPPNALPAPVASTTAAGQVGMYRYSAGGRASSAPCAPSRSATPPTPVVSRRAAISRASASRGSGAIPSGVRLSGAGRVGGGPPGGARTPASAAACTGGGPRQG